MGLKNMDGIEKTWILQLWLQQPLFYFLKHLPNIAAKCKFNQSSQPLFGRGIDLQLV